MQTLAYGGAHGYVIWASGKHSGNFKCMFSNTEMFQHCLQCSWS